jgi:nitrate reductase NapE component
MTDRIKRAWHLAVALAPILAIALVEGATRRW